jgi:hypothetical protein
MQSFDFQVMGVKHAILQKVVDVCIDINLLTDFFCSSAEANQKHVFKQRQLSWFINIMYLQTGSFLVCAAAASKQYLKYAKGLLQLITCPQLLLPSS